MPDTRATFDPEIFLQKQDSYNFAIETSHNDIVAILETTRTNYRNLQEEARKACIAFIDLKKRLNKRVEKEEAKRSDMLKVLGMQRDLVEKGKREKRGLKERLAILTAQLKEAEQELEAGRHQKCQICIDKMKAVITKCGHGFCEGCLNHWFRDARAKGAEDEETGYISAFLEHDARCPACRTLITQEDVRPLFL